MNSINRYSHRCFSWLYKIANACVVINPHEPLHHHKAFWIPIIAAGSVSLYVGYNTSSFDWEYLLNPKETMDALAYPIFILSFSLPVVLAVGRFHASAQRAETIRISNTTMSFKHYFDHREAFFDYAKQYEAKYEYISVQLVKPFRSYEVFFPNSSMDFFDIEGSGKSLVILNAKLDSIVERLDNLKAPSSNLSPRLTIDAFDALGIKVTVNLAQIEEHYPRGLDKGAEPLTNILDMVLALYEHLAEFDQKNPHATKLVLSYLSKALVPFAKDSELNDKVSKMINSQYVVEYVRGPDVL